MTTFGICVLPITKTQKSTVYPPFTIVNVPQHPNAARTPACKDLLQTGAKLRPIGISTTIRKLFVTTCVLQPSLGSMKQKKIVAIEDASIFLEILLFVLLTLSMEIIFSIINLKIILQSVPLIVLTIKQ